MANLQVGKPDVRPDAPAHYAGHQAGQRGRQLREPGRATTATGRSTARALHRHQRRGRASRSTRACRTSRRPSVPLEARPDTGAGRSRSTSPSGCAAPLELRGRPDAALRAADRGPSGDPVRSVLLDVAAADRGPPARATTPRPSTSGWPSCSATPRRAGARRCARCRGLRHDVGRRRRSRERRWSTSHVPCTYDFEVAASQVPRRRCDDGEVPLEFLFSGTVFYAATAGAAGGADRRGRARPSTAAGGGLAGDDGPLLPGQRLAAALRESFDRLRRTGRARAAELGRDRRARCWTAEGDRWTRPARSPTPCSTRATCSGRTGARRSRTSAAGPSAASTRRRGRRAPGRPVRRCRRSACSRATPRASRRPRALPAGGASGRCADARRGRGRRADAWTASAIWPGRRRSSARARQLEAARQAADRDRGREREEEPGAAVPPSVALGRAAGREVEAVGRAAAAGACGA